MSDQQAKKPIVQRQKKQYEGLRKLKEFLKRTKGLESKNLTPKVEEPPINPEQKKSNELLIQEISKKEINTHTSIEQSKIQKIEKKQKIEPNKKNENVESAEQNEKKQVRRQQKLEISFERQELREEQQERKQNSDNQQRSQIMNLYVLGQAQKKAINQRGPNKNPKLYKRKKYPLSQQQAAKISEIQRRSISIQNIEYNTTEEQLKQYFEEKCQGKVKRITIRNKNNLPPNRPKRAFLEFQNRFSVHGALQLHGKQFKGLPLKIELKEKPKNDDTPPIGDLREKFKQFITEKAMKSLMNAFNPK